MMSRTIMMSRLNDRAEVLTFTDTVSTAKLKTNQSIESDYQTKQSKTQHCEGFNPTQCGIPDK